MAPKSVGLQNDAKNNAIDVFAGYFSQGCTCCLLILSLLLFFVFLLNI